MAAPDPKPTVRKGNQPRRIVNRTAVEAAKERRPYCMACGRWAGNGSAHHILARGTAPFGDDVEGNIGVLCGSGTSGCHGAHHGAPYVDLTSGERRDAEWVNSRIMGHLIFHREDTIEYLTGKMGDRGRALMKLTRIYGPVVYLTGI